METISAARRIIAPFIIYQGKTHRISYYVSGLAPKASDVKTQRQGPHKIVRNPGVQGNSKFKAAASIVSTWRVVEARDTTFAVSPSGYMDDDLGFAYISEHFEPATRLALVKDKGKGVLGPSLLSIYLRVLK